jgi:hypothetical protein
MHIHRPPGRLQRALAGLALVAASLLLLVPSGHGAATRGDGWPLHAGSHGARVTDLQWLLAGHRPYKFTQVKPTFKAKPNGELGARTKTAIREMKYRIGYPVAGQCGARGSMVTVQTGPQFFSILKGKTKRPACWVALAAKRVKAVNVGPTALAVKARAYEQQLLAHGIIETPTASNAGPCISRSCLDPMLGTIPALQSATGAYDLAWCVSTQQTVLRAIGYGTFAGDTANVYQAVDYAAARNWLSAKPKIGALVAFIDYDSHGNRIPGTGHLGFVAKVEASSFTYIAGNDANRVNEHTIPDGSRSYAFIYLPGLA